MHSLILPLLVTAAAANGLSQRQDTGDVHAHDAVCLKIASNITGSVFFSDNKTTINQFNDALFHYMNSSFQEPLCVVQVNDARDLQTAISIIGAKKKPFAVRSAGYTSNPGFSSTPGIHISLEKLKTVKISADRQRVEVGPGNSFTEVYSALDGTNVTVLGARADGPGTGGVTLSGGYSWYTNQYGLACDTIISYDVVLANGTSVTASNSSHSDLFFALKGGLNRFGIVTKFVFKAIRQPPNVYGGLQIFPPEQVPALLTALQSFHTNSKDPKASVILTLGGGTLPGAIMLSFYDGPNRPKDFDVFNNIKSTVSTLKTQNYTSLIKGTLTSFQEGNRGTFASVSTTNFTQKFLDAVVNETKYWSQFTNRSPGLLQYDVEPFQAYGKFATDSAYPHKTSPMPLNAYFSWKNPADDEFWNTAIQKSIAQVTEVARAEGILCNESVYPGYAYRTTPADQLYGKVNAAKLRGIRAAYDPAGVMELAGGFQL